MKKFLFLSAVAFLSAFSQFTLAQDFGLSFSYFVPKNGYFSAPISPFSIRGLGVDFNRNFAFETGATLYRISGLSLKNLPFEYDGPLTGPNFTVFVPAELVLMLQAGDLEIDLKAGGFVFYAFDLCRVSLYSFRSCRNSEVWSPHSRNHNKKSTA